MGGVAEVRSLDKSSHIRVHKEFFYISSADKVYGSCLHDQRENTLTTDHRPIVLHISSVEQ